MLVSHLHRALPALHISQLHTSLTDVPPLEDMTEFVAKAQSIRAKQQQLQEAPPAKAASTSAQKAKDKPEAKAQPRSEHHPSQFGGMRKGFLFASAKEEPKKQKTAAGKTRQSKPSTSSSAAAAEVPFIKPAEKQKGLELPEVQAAMKASLGSFGSHGIEHSAKRKVREMNRLLYLSRVGDRRPDCKDQGAPGAFKGVPGPQSQPGHVAAHHRPPGHDDSSSEQSGDAQLHEGLLRPHGRSLLKAGRQTNSAEPEQYVYKPVTLLHV